MASKEGKLKANSDDLAPEVGKTRKMMNITVVFLDNSSYTFRMPSKALGRTLFDKVCKMLNLFEVDYFGLEYEDDSHAKYWLDGLKPLCHQVGLTDPSPSFSFCVKFYTPDPIQLEDEFTRYLFSLQLKRDLAGGSLHCNDNTTAVLLSYIVQAELGDYDPEEFPDHRYLARNQLVPYQDVELEKKVMESHKKHAGQTPAEAELNLLETARRCELYGVRMTTAKDHEGLPLNLAVAHLGVLVFQNFTKINTFSWAKIRKLSFKRKKFLIKLHPEGYGYYKDTVEFFFEGRNECKNFWKKCIENHTFFRCTDATKGMRQKPKLFSRGSSFRYSGRTQVQLSEYVRGNYVKRNFERSTSLRTTPNSPSKTPSGPKSPQPLLPVSTSFSYETMAVNSIKQSSPSLKKLSASEPATPHVAQDIAQTIENGVVSNQDIEARSTSPGLTTPDSELGGYQTPDYMGQETDDNISHDSYHVIEKAESPLLSSKLNGNGHHLVSASNSNNMNIEDVSNDQKVDFAARKHLQLDLKKVYSTSVEENGNEKEKFQYCIDDVPLTPQLNGSRSISDRNGDVEGHYMNDTSDSLPSADIPSFRSESFNSLSESHLSSNRKTPTDKGYFLAKELLMTERTYRRDLEIIDVVFREEFIRQKQTTNDAVEAVLSCIGPLYELHCSLLRDLEQRLAFWEGKHVKVGKNAIRGVGDVFIDYENMTDMYDTYVTQLDDVLRQLDEELEMNPSFSSFYHEFELLEVCYLPLTSLLLRPLYRLAQYCDTLRALTEYYGKLHKEYSNCQQMLNKFHNAFLNMEDKIPVRVNFVKLMELERNLSGFPDGFLTKETVFVREGCLQKLSKNESHQCMIFLFSNMLLCCKQVTSKKLKFKVQSSLLLSNLKVAEIEPRHAANYCFTVQRGDKCLFLAASSERERSRWIKDIIATFESANQNASSSQILAPGCHTSVEEDKEISHHVNTSIHVCWHRSISIGKEDLLISLKYCMSSFLLRKFKNNSGWQKLWVVLSNLCLFFFKSFLDESPLTSLPLSGYRITSPSTEDAITKEWVFKLQYKQYEYFFRAESKFIFDRWMTLIHHATLAGDEKTRL